MQHILLTDRQPCSGASIVTPGKLHTGTDFRSFPGPGTGCVARGCRERILEVQEKTGFIPNVFLHDELMHDIDIETLRTYKEALVRHPGGKGDSRIAD